MSYKLLFEYFLSFGDIRYIIHIFDSGEFWDKISFKKYAEIMLINLYHRYDIIFIDKEFRFPDSISDI